MGKFLTQKFKYWCIGIIFLILYTFILSLVLKTKEVIVREKIIEVQKVVEAQKKIEVPVKKIEVYKKGVINEIVIPPNLILYPNDYITSSSVVKSDEDYNHVVTSVLNIETGKINTYDVKEPLPWVAFNKRGRINSSIGMMNHELYSRTEVTGEFMQVKELHLGVVVGIDKPLSGKIEDSETYIGLGGWINF